MIRQTPLRRTRFKKKSARRIAKETEEETAYKRWLHLLPCVVTGYVGERVQASHVGSGGMGQKKGSSWFDAVPMEASVHAEWGERRGRFDGWSRAMRDTMSAIWLRKTMQRWEFVRMTYGF